MTPVDVANSRIIRVKLKLFGDEIDVVHAPGHVTRYCLWRDENGQLKGEIRDITMAGIITRLATDRDIFDLGMLAIKTKWGLKRKPED